MDRQNFQTSYKKASVGIKSHDLHATQCKQLHHSAASKLNLMLIITFSLRSIDSNTLSTSFSFLRGNVSFCSLAYFPALQHLTFLPKVGAITWWNCFYLYTNNNRPANWNATFRSLLIWYSAFTNTKYNNFPIVLTDSIGQRSQILPLILSLNFASIFFWKKKVSVSKKKKKMGDSFFLVFFLFLSLPHIMW